MNPDIQGRQGAADPTRADLRRATGLEGRSIAVLAREHDVSHGAVRTAVADLRKWERIFD
ncbi:hypothetical protein J2Z21_000269 [Streptomyces griseochromogenes]|uniref:Uncharacterized protein n=1 Tax=Streptomyces griseochromogenes TaxID=68214 RepID=A0ABS4LIY8_9ACTN|nr:hypothetical protein [Streptomyces griseochromogenes]